jgi:hypothetical protein
MIFCARATRGLRRVGGAVWSSPCSRNAHDKNVLVRRAQSRINQATLESEVRDWDDARSGSSISPHPWEKHEQAWKDHLKSCL